MASPTLLTSAILRSRPHLSGKLMEESLEKPRRSIIIPTNNSGETIEECLRSIQGQDYLEYEVIIVDNFSNDNTLKMAKKLGARIRKSGFLRHPECRLSSQHDRNHFN